MKARSTRQLSATYDVLVGSADHPTADQVLERVRRAIPRISLGTVYRNLEKLREQGRMRVIRLGDGVAHFDAMTDAHDHFVCERCGAVTDLATSGAAAADATLQRAGYVVHWRTTAVYGLCRDCAGRGANEA